MSNTVVRTNILAMNSHRNLGLVSNMQARASRNLSSGFRINSAADDAAGLAISEGMRAQIRGMAQASRNTQDGISLIQTSEGYMQTIKELAQRMRELSIQGANDTNNAEQRAFIAAEMAQMQSEIERIWDTATFNGQAIFAGTAPFVPEVNGPTAPDAPDAPFTTADAINWADLLVQGNFSIAAADEDGNVFSILDPTDRLATGGLGLNTGFQAIAVVDTATQHAAINNAVNNALRSLVGYEGNTAEGMNAAVATWIGEQGVYIAGSSNQTFNQLFDSGNDGIANIQVARDAVTAALNEAVDVQQFVERAPAPTTVEQSTPLFDFTNNSIRIHGDVISQVEDVVGATNALRGALASWMTQNVPGVAGDAMDTDLFVSWLEDAASGTLWQDNTGAGDATHTFTLESFLNADLAVNAVTDFWGAFTPTTANVVTTSGGTTAFEIPVGADPGDPVSGFARQTALDGTYRYVAVTGVVAADGVTATWTAVSASDLLGEEGLTEAGRVLRNELIDYINNAMTDFLPSETAPPVQSDDVGILVGNFFLQVGPDGATTPGRGHSLQVSGEGGQLGNVVEVTGQGIERIRHLIGGISQEYLDGTQESGTGIYDHATFSSFTADLDIFIGEVNALRAGLGAIQNRLEFTIENLDIARENLSAAESRIRDADMALEMMRLTQANVLQQAATAMLAQGNQAPQNVLQLLG